MWRSPKKEILACSSGKGDREERSEYENVRRGGGEEEKGKERESGRREERGKKEEEKKKKKEEEKEMENEHSSVQGLCS